MQMMAQFLKRLPHIKLRIVFAALFAILIVHLLATLAAPKLAPSPAYSRLADVLPANTMQVLAPITPDTQPLPFMGPDARYAVCRFDTTKGTVTITAGLAGAGWSLSLYSEKGDNFYTSVGRPDRRTEIALQLSTKDDSFTGLTPEASGESIKLDRSLTLSAKRGLAILRAPDQGRAYRMVNEAELKRSVCAVKRPVTAARSN